MDRTKEKLRLSTTCCTREVPIGFNMSPNGKAAQAYASKLKWAVFPLHTPEGNRCSCHNRNCKSIGKHPRVKNGVKEATTSLDIINKWWRKWPEANIGIATGKPNGFITLDIDPRHGGDDSLNNLVDQYASLPETIEAVTGGGGRHILFKSQGQIKNRTNIVPGVDVRGDGGYIVGSPSLHISGNRYEWELSSRPLEVPLESMPEWLLKMIAEPEQDKSIKKSERYWLEILQGVGEGERNMTAASFAGYLLRHGITAPVTFELMILWNERNEPPHSIDELELTFHSILSRETKRLRGEMNNNGY
ncbi:bifunctional DNA primase/polymerase [Priestia aryabhattai]|uniref:bifunctional DNA primase/polymerase n=1 Tax=Priestia aryabhattai TaxID=412384 RepID=UPI003CFA0A7C